jgi:hypothetical protein
MTMPKGWENKNKTKQDRPAPNKPKRADYPDDRSYEDALMKYLLQTEGQWTDTRKQQSSASSTAPAERHPQYDDQVIAQRNLTKGFWNPKIVETQMITTRAVRINGQVVLDFATIDDVQVTNFRSTVEGDYYTYGNEHIAMTDGQTRVRSFGDIVFFRQGQMVFRFENVEDLQGVVALIVASIRGRGY